MLTICAILRLWTIVVSIIHLAWIPLMFLPWRCAILFGLLPIKCVLLILLLQYGLGVLLYQSLWQIFRILQSLVKMNTGFDGMNRLLQHILLVDRKMDLPGKLSHLPICTSSFFSFLNYELLKKIFFVEFSFVFYFYCHHPLPMPSAAPMDFPLHLQGMDERTIVSSFLQPRISVRRESIWTLHLL